ncbi:amidase family protein [Candidatus Pelagibacter sp.]|nr:amidase family protein [Candidatus Pelagibacter sp.]
MLENKSVKEIISLIKTKETSIKEVVSFYLERIKKYNISLNAIVSIKDEEQIINEAKDKDENFDESKPLFGLPLASKDLLDVVDFPTTYGFPGYKDYFPKKNSIIVDRQLDAGGIMIGKTNTAELGVGAHTANRLFGITPNIYGDTQSSGGSSGGAGVAVAAELLPFADGTDMMGSCRTPAAYANVYGFRPTPGLLPDYRTNDKKKNLPIISTPGCLARTPDDMAILLDVIAGEHKEDPISFSLNNSFKDTYISDQEFSKIKIGWLSDMNGNYQYDSELVEMCNKQLSSLEKNKVIIESLKPNIDAHKLWNCWGTLRAKSIYEDIITMNIGEINQMTPQAIWEYNKGIKLTEEDIKLALNSRIELSSDVNSLFGGFDFLALPSQQSFPFDKNLRYPEKINDQLMDTYHRWIEIHIFASLFYLPSISLPIGFNKDGFPIGIQIIAKNKRRFKSYIFCKKI